MPLPSRNVWPACSGQRLLLWAQRRVSLTQHAFSHGECADHAAALGAMGPVSRHNILERWPHRRQNSNRAFGTRGKSSQGWDTLVPLDSLNFPIWPTSFAFEPTTSCRTLLSNSRAPLPLCHVVDSFSAMLFSAFALGCQSLE